MMSAFVARENRGNRFRIMIWGRPRPRNSDERTAGHDRTSVSYRLSDIDHHGVRCRLLGVLVDYPEDSVARYHAQQRAAVE
jgi:hypothetical protein